MTKYIEFEINLGLLFNTSNITYLSNFGDVTMDSDDDNPIGKYMIYSICSNKRHIAKIKLDKYVSEDLYCYRGEEFGYPKTGPSLDWLNLRTILLKNNSTKQLKDIIINS